MSPALVLVGLLILITAQLLYAVGPYRRRSAPAIFALTAIGILAGQAWGNAGLPAFKLGAVSLLPSVIFALALQPLSRPLARLLDARPGRRQRSEEAPDGE